MKDDYRQHSRCTKEYQEGYYGTATQNPYEGGTVEWLNWSIGREEASGVIFV